LRESNTSLTGVKRPLKRRKSVIYLVPSLVLIFAFVVYPAVLMVWTSLSRQNFSGSLVGWAGLSNYRRALADAALPSVIINTLEWTVVVVGFTLVLSFAVALLLNEIWPGRKLVRAMLIVPWAASLAVTSLIFRWMLDSRFGAANVILQKLGLIDGPVAFLNSASISFPILMAIGIFVSIPFTTYILLAGLHSISPDLTEAASLDGAGWLQQVRYLVLPLLAPFLVTAVLFNMVYVFNSFPIIWIITNGGPARQTDILITYLYRQAFTAGDITVGAALSTIGFLFLSVVAASYWLITQRRNAA